MRWAKKTTAPIPARMRAASGNTIDARKYTMQRQDMPSQIVMGPQLFKDTIYGDAQTGWLTIFYTPSRHTLWFPVTDPVPDLDLEQNCYPRNWYPQTTPPTTVRDAARPTTSSAFRPVARPRLPEPRRPQDPAPVAPHRRRGPDAARCSALQAVPHRPFRARPPGLLAVQGTRRLRHQARPGGIQPTVPRLATAIPAGRPRPGLARGQHRRPGPCSSHPRHTQSQDR